MSNISCNIIRDLLPSYLDKLTSDESNELVEAHLQGCPACREVLAALSQTVAVDTTEASREIDYLKKIRAKRRKILLVAVLACTLFFGAIAAIGIKVFVIGSPVSFAVIDGDKTDEFVGIGTRFDPQTNELTLYGEIQLRQTAFSGIKVEPAKGLVNAYNVTVYGAERFGDTQQHNRKFEYTFKIPDDNNNWSVYSVGEIPQDTILFWSNAEYVDQKAALSLQKLTAYLTEHNGFSAETQHLERDWAEEILGDPCFIFDCHDAADCMGRNNSVPYAVSVDGARVYGYDTTKQIWVQL